MFVHCVYFWLKGDLTEHQRATFRAGLESLTGIASVRKAHIGVPAATNRPIIERSYHCALIVMFDDQAGHDHYQEVALHQVFRDNCSQMWSKVVIFDSQTAS